VELAEALQTFLRVARHGIKLILTTQVAPRDLALVEPARQMAIELDKGLESPYAENILRAMDADGTLGLSDLPNEPESLREARHRLLREARDRTLGFPRALEALFAILSVDRYATLPEVLNDAAKLLPDNVVEVLVGEAFSRLDSVKQKVMQSLAIYNMPVIPAAVDFLLQPYLPGFNGAPLLNRLVNAHLVRKESERYHLHPVDRQFAFSRLPPGEVSDACEGPNPPFTRFALLHRGAEYFRQGRKPRERWKTIADLSPQLAEIDLRGQAMEWDTVASVLLEFNDQLKLWGHYRLVAELYGRSLDRLSDTRLKAICQVHLGDVLYRLGEYGRAILVLQDALISSRDAKDRINEAWAELGLAGSYVDVGKTLVAEEHFNLAIGIFRDLGELGSEGRCLNNLGFFLGDLGRTADALECHKKSLQISLSIPDLESATIARANKGARLNELGFTDEAIDCCHEALTEAQKLGYRYGESVNLVYLGDCHADKNDWKNALCFYDEARTIAVEIGNPQFEIHASIGLAEANLFSGYLLQAVRFIEEAGKYHVPRTNYEVLVLRGVIALRRNELQVARETFFCALEQSETVLSDANSHAKALDYKGLALCGLALSGGQKKLAAAIQAFQAARACSKAPGRIKRVLRRFDMLVSRGPEAIPAEVRLALVGHSTRDGG
jgi:tetratricopeptide (TPR) repeat protein